MKLLSGMKKLFKTRSGRMAVGFLLLPVVATCLTPGFPYRKPEQVPSGIVDMHCHIAGIGSGGSGCFVSPGLRGNWRFEMYLRSFGVTRAEVEEKGDSVVADRISESLSQSRFVCKAVILAMDGVVGDDGLLDTNRTEFYVPDEYVARLVSTRTNLLFGASVNPYRNDALERLSRAKSAGAVLVKWLPPIMEIDPADPRLAPFYRKLVELNLPLLTHTGAEGSFSRATASLGDPAKLRLPLSLGVKVIAAHAGAAEKYEGEDGQKRLAVLMREFPNLYADVSSLTQVNRPGKLRYALTAPEFSGRLCYGTDYPLIKTAMVSPWYYPFRLSLRQRIAVYREKNPWDADVRLKQALGTPAHVFTHFQNIAARPSI